MTDQSSQRLREFPFACGGLQLTEARTGSEPASFLCLHGVTRRWQSFLPIVAPLAVRHTLGLIDLRGHGSSARAPGYRVVDYVGDLVERLRQAPRPVVLYGHSLGAMVAAGAAAACPDRVRGLILEDPPFETMGARIAETRLLSYFRGISELGGSESSFASHLRRLPAIRLVDPVSGQTQRVGDVRDPVFLRFTARSLTLLDPRVLEPIVSGGWLEGYDFREILSRVACPLLLLRADPELGGMLTAEDFHWCKRRLPNVTGVEFPKTPHLIHTARPLELATYVLGFVESLGDQ